MRLSSHKRRERRMELQMTSMIDVVFLLLIFFMMTMSFVKTERELNPAIQVDEKSKVSAVDFEPAIVEILGAGSTHVYRIGGRDLTSPSELTEILRVFDHKVDGAFVKVSDSAPFDMAAAAIQACKNAGFPAVSYLPLESN